MAAPSRLILFSGMGADHRLMAPIGVEGLAAVRPDHLEPLPDESLADYAGRCADPLDIGPGDVIGGASFGGMVAAQIAAGREVAGLVLLGTCVHPERMPRSYAKFEWLSRWLPDAVLRARRWRWVLRRRLGPLTPEAEACLLEMAEDCPISRIRAFGRMIVQWRGVHRLDCPVVSVHGALDRVIPIRCAEPGHAIPDAGHAFTLTHAEAANTALAAFVRRLSDDG